MTARELIDITLRESGHGTLARLEAEKWLDVQPPFDKSHYLNGFGHADGRFHFKPDWGRVRDPEIGPFGPWADMPALPDHWQAIEEADERLPFRLATSPARQFLNSSFNETPTARAKEGRPEAMIHPDDAAARGIADGEWVRLRNGRGAVLLRARLSGGVRRGVIIAEGIWPNSAFPDGKGINTLTGADAVAPYGGAAFHDSRVALERVGSSVLEEGFLKAAFEPRINSEPELA
jgi:anaerobic selenocysteine-containing dehydrogenase